MLSLRAKTLLGFAALCALLAVLQASKTFEAFETQSLSPPSEEFSGLRTESGEKTSETADVALKQQLMQLRSENQRLKDALETGRGAASQITSDTDTPKEVSPLSERVNESIESIESPAGWRDESSDVMIPDGVREGMLEDSREYTTGNSWGPSIKFVAYPKEVEPKACREPSTRQFLRYTYRPWNLFESLRYRGWYGHGETPMCRVDLNDIRPLNSADRYESCKLNETIDSLQTVGMKYCSLNDDSYRCKGDAYEDYLKKHVVGKEAHVQDLPRDSIVIMFGDSHLRQIIIATLCELGCQEVHSELWMMMITGYFPETNTHVVGFFNAKFNKLPPEEWAIDIKEGLAPLGHLTQTLQTYFLLGNAYLVGMPSGVSYVPYQASAQALKTVFPKAAVLFFWSWTPLYPANGASIDYGPPFSTNDTTAMKWCYESDECIGPTDALGYPEAMNCRSDGENCESAELNGHQCLPGLPTLISRQLLVKIRKLSQKVEVTAQHS